MQSTETLEAPIAPLEPAKRGAAKESAEKPIPRDRPVDEVAIEMAKARMLPRPPGRKLTYDEMQAWFALLTSEMWHHVVVYVYRHFPRIIRKLRNPDNTNYIDCISQPFDLDYIAEHHGGGKYNLLVVDSEIKGTNNKLFDCDFEIDANKYPPKLNYEELDINHKGNMAYVQLLQHRGILDSRGQVMENQINGAGQSDMAKAAFEFASKVISDQQQAVKDKQNAQEQQTLSKSVGDILLEKMKQDDPNKASAPLLGIVEKVLAAKPADGNSQIFEKVIAVITSANQQALQMTTENNKTVLAMFQQLSEAQAQNKREDPQIEQLERVFNFAERLAGMRGGGGARNGWEVGLDYVKELGVPALQTIANLISLNKTGRPMPPAAPGASGAPNVAFDPYRDPAAMRALSQAQQQAAPQNASTAPGTAQSAPANDLAALAQTYAHLVINHLNAGTPGHAFADYFAGLFGMGMHAEVCAHGEPALAQALLSVPEIAKFGEPRIKKFVHEFADFQAILDQEEDGDEEEEPRQPNSAYAPAS